MGIPPLSAFGGVGELGIDWAVLLSSPAALLFSVGSRVKRPKIDVMRSSAAAMASNEVGERAGRERIFKTGSLSLEGGEVGVLKVSPFFKCIFEPGESVDRVGRVLFKTGRRRGCSRDGSG